MATITGAVNGVPTTADVEVMGDDLVTIPYFPAGATTTLDVDTDGNGLHPVNHRVAIVGGNVSGRDHFPFSVADVDGSYASGGAIPVDGEIACRWFYLVKTWRVEAYCELNQDASPDPSNNQILSISNDFGYPAYGSVSHEADLVVFPQSLGGRFDAGDATLYFTQSAFSSQFDGIGIFFPSAVHAFDENVEITIQTANRDLEEGGPAPDTTVENGFRVHDSLFGGGGEIQMNVYIFIGTGRTLVDAHIDLTPVEFWPYATTEGDPVYNTTTGAQLNDPLS